MDAAIFARWWCSPTTKNSLRSAVMSLSFGPNTSFSIRAWKIQDVPFQAHCSQRLCVFKFVCNCATPHPQGPRHAIIIDVMPCDFVESLSPPRFPHEGLETSHTCINMDASVFGARDGCQVTLVHLFQCQSHKLRFVLGHSQQPSRTHISSAGRTS